MRPLKVLVVDNKSEIQELYRKAFPEDLFLLDFAPDGRQGLDRYRSWKPDIMLVDILLPEMTGNEVLKFIRTHLRDHLTTIIMVSSLKAREDVMECVTFGIQGFIAKPFDVETISSRVLTYYIERNPQAAHIALENLRVLVVDPNLEDQQCYQRAMSEEVFECRVCVGGEDSLGAYAEWHPDIMVTELDLPGISGLDLLHEIREVRGDRSLTVIIASASEGEEETKACIEKGIHGYIVKPLDETSLSAKILKCYMQLNPYKARAAEGYLRFRLQGGATPG